jgi:hypothetical protein
MNTSDPYAPPSKTLAPSRPPASPTPHASVGTSPAPQPDTLPETGAGPEVIVLLVTATVALAFGMGFVRLAKFRRRR